MVACSTSDEMFRSDLFPNSLNSPRHHYKDVPQDDDDTKADEPTQVSGAFLSMAFMEDETTTLEQIRSSPNTEIEIAACLRNKVSLNCINDNSLQFNFKILNAEYEIISIKQRPASPGIDFNFIVKIPVSDLAATLFVFIVDSKSRKQAVKSRSLTSINEFGAKYGPGSISSISKYHNRSKWFDSAREAQALDYREVSSNKNQNGFSGGSSSGNLSAFWGATIDVLKDEFGNNYAKPSTKFDIESMLNCMNRKKLEATDQNKQDKLQQPIALANIDDAGEDDNCQFEANNKVDENE